MAVHEFSMDWPVLLALVCTAIVLVASLALGRVRRELSVIKGPKGWPYVGVLAELTKHMKTGSFHVLLQRWAKEYGSVYKFIIMGQTFYIISDLKLANKVVLHRPADFSRRRIMAEYIEELGGKGLFTAEGQDWHRQRRITAPAFTALKVSDRVGPISQVVARVLQKWEAKVKKQEPIDALVDLRKYALDVVSLVSYGFDLDSLGGDSEMQKDIDLWFTVAARRLFATFPTWRYPLLASEEDREMVRALRRMKEVVVRTVKKHQQGTQEPGKDVTENLLMRLLEGAAAEGEEGKRIWLKEEELFGNILTFYIAGQDTTASTTAWALFYLATMPHIQDKVREEVDRVMGPAAAELDTVVGALSHVEPSELKYVSAVIKETLRLKPVGPWMAFQANKSMKLVEGLVVHPKDTVVVLGIATSKSGEFFENALTFEPGRWENDTHALGLTPGSSPFGWGQRICPGRFLAFLEVQMLVAAVCQRFVVTLADNCPEESVRELDRFTLQPSHLLLKLHPRQ